MNRTIKSITYEVDGEQWTATVGKKLHGSKAKIGKDGSKQTQRLSDEATVVSITLQEGVLCRVKTDGRPYGRVVSTWLNPFLATATHISYTDEQ